MDLLGVVLSGLIAALPKAGPIIATVVHVVIGGVTVSTAIVALMHSLSAVAKALVAAGVKKAQPEADAVEKAAIAADGLLGKLSKIVAQLSVLPLPK